MDKVGLVLSGGGVRGIAHLGLLKALDEFDMRPSAISGVSAGALTGAMYAAGIPPEEILEIGKRQINFGFSNILWRRGGLLSKEFIHHTLLKYIPHNSFEKLDIPLFVNATDFANIQTVYFSSGELIPCLEASASVPVIFDPVTLKDQMLVDGGLLNNFPVEPLMGICDKILGFHVNKLKPSDNNGKRLSRFAIMERCYHISISTSVYEKAHYCDLFLEPDLHQFGMFDTRKADKIFQAGYRHALENKDRILKLVTED